MCVCDLFNYIASLLGYSFMHFNVIFQFINDDIRYIFFSLNIIKFIINYHFFRSIHFILL